MIATTSVQKFKSQQLCYSYGKGNNFGQNVHRQQKVVQQQIQRKQVIVLAQKGKGSQQGKDKDKDSSKAQEIDPKDLRRTDTFDLTDQEPPSQRLQDRAVETQSQAEDQAEEIQGQVQETVQVGQEQLSSVAQDASEQGANLTGSIQQQIINTTESLGIQAAVGNASDSFVQQTTINEPIKVGRMQAVSRISQKYGYDELDENKKGSKEEIEDLKKNIINKVAAIDRGFAATAKQALEIQRLSEEIVSKKDPIQLTWEQQRDGQVPPLELLNGKWRLIYTSQFVQRLPNVGIGLNKIGMITQVIDTIQQRLNNEIQILTPNPLGALIGPGGTLAGIIGTGAQITQDLPVLELSLQHTFEIKESKQDITIVFENTEAKILIGQDQQPTFNFSIPELPEFLRPSRDFRKSSFQESYLDDDFRITLGDKNELRIFTKLSGDLL